MASTTPGNPQDEADVRIPPASDVPGATVPRRAALSPEAYERALLVLSLALETCRTGGGDEPPPARAARVVDGLVPPGARLAEWRKHLADGEQDLDDLLFASRPLP